MTPAHEGRGTLSDLLEDGAVRALVGREAETELFRAALEQVQREPERPLWTVLHVHGPGGVGKSALLDLLAVAAREVGRPVVRLDLGELPARREAITAALTAQRPDLVSPVALLVDGYERVGSSDGWVRDELVPALPVGSLVVLAGRTPPSPGWRSSPTWCQQTRELALRDLDDEAGLAYLHRHGVVDDADRLLALTHGHPLALSLLVDVLRRGGQHRPEPWPADVVDVLLRRFLDLTPDAGQRRALHVLGLARTTTGPLLRAVLGADEAVTAFDWLRQLSFVRSSPTGLRPHELVRDLLDVDLRWRDDEAYRDTYRRVQRHLADRVLASTGRRRLDAALEAKFTYRNLAGLLSPMDWSSWGSLLPEPAAGGDREEVLALVRRHEGHQAAVWAETWWRTQPHGWHVVRDDDGVRGVVARLDLTVASPQARAADPVAASAWRHAHEQARAGPTDRVHLCRFVIDREAYQDPSPTVNAAPLVNLLAYVDLPGTALDYLALRSPDRWDDWFALADMPRAREADVELDGSVHGLFWHDFRRTPLRELLTLWSENALDVAFEAAPRQAPAPTTPSRATFDRDVRQALRDLRRPDLLERNPLVRCRLVLARPVPDEEPGAVLRQVVEAAVDSLRQDPRDDPLWRAVTATYLGSSRTQDAAAAALGTPSSTYRRHLSRGVQRVSDWCWQREVVAWDVEQ